MTTSYTGLLQSAFCYARHELSMAEYMALMFIYQRTYRYNQKQSESIPLRHFLEGVYDREGNPICAPVSCDKATVLKAINGLVAKGLILVNKTKKTNVYSLIVSSIEEFSAMAASKLKISRKHKVSDVVGNPTNDVVGIPTNISNRDKVIESKLSDSSDEEVTLVEALEGAKQKTIAARSKKGHSLTKANTYRQFKDAVKKHFPESPHPTDFSKHGWYKFRSAASSRPPSVPMPEFLDWVAQHWSVLRGHDLSWVNGMGNVPDLGTLSSLYKYFLMAHIEGTVSKRLNREKSNVGGKETVSERRRAEQAEREARDLKDKLAASEMAQEHYRRIAQEKEKRKAEKKTRRSVPVPTELAEPLGEWQDHEE